MGKRAGGIRADVPLRLSDHLSVKFAKPVSQMPDLPVGKGIRKPCGFDHISKEIGSGQTAELQVALPGALTVSLHPDAVLQGIRLSDRIVNIVER